jgi:NAD(P)-dependent dehydrogenase (short-subunit alcohol dehydrogenase family)
LASLTKPKIEEVARKINEAFPDVQIQIITFDLASQESIRQAAKEINADTPKIDVLINNAGVVSSARRWTKEGIELQFGANHIGHFLLTSLLIDKLKAAARQSTPGATRVVNITSLAHRLSPIRFHDYNFEGKEIPDDEKPMKGISDRMLRGTDGYPGFLAYGQSKTANVLFASELARRFHDQGINAFSVHPGSELPQANGSGAIEDIRFL